jgi:hypothetical protein
LAATWKKQLDRVITVVVSYNSITTEGSFELIGAGKSSLGPRAKTNELFEESETMKSLRNRLSVILIALSAVGFAQSAAQKPVAQSDTHAHQAADTAAPKSDAQKSFDTLKTLAGVWTAKLTVDPPQPDMDDKLPSEVSMRVTSRGNALVHEMYAVGVPNDPSRYDHPITMLYLDGDHLNLVHYCDAGNRPRMVARSSPDGKTVEFDFVDISGSTQYGHMQHAVFTMIDANHHIEDWTYMMPGDKPVHAHFDLQRKNEGSVVAGK